jgi:hypothetical protein
MLAFETQLDNLWRRSREWEKNRSELGQSVEGAATLASEAFSLSDGIAIHLTYGMENPGHYETSLRTNLSAMESKLKWLRDSLRIKNGVSVRNDYKIYVQHFTDWLDQTGTELECASLPPGVNAAKRKTTHQGKRGRKALSSDEATKRTDILEKWGKAKDADTCRKDFCHDHKIELATLEKYQDWQCQRTRRKNPEQI